VVAADDAQQAEALRATLASIAPGTSLRDGLERILRGRTGALIVLGHDKVVDTISTGGFTLVLAGAKAWLEQGLTLGLIGDRHPKGVPGR